MSLQIQNAAPTAALRHLQMPLSERLTQRTAQSLEPERPTNFADLLVSGVNQVNNMQHGANELVHQLLTGGDVQQAEVMTAVQKADMAFRMLVQVRNKLLQAYEEINAIRI